MKKLYLDICVLCRPFDDQSMMRIRFETDAVYLILQNVQNGKYQMMVSAVHMREIRDIKEVRERAELFALFDNYGLRVSCNLKEIRKRAEMLCFLKFGIADAAHVAFAEKSADVFITCDDKLLKKCHKKGVDVLVVNPIDFCLQEDLK